MFAIAVRGEQPVNESLVRAGSCVAKKRVNLVWSWRESGQDQRYAANQPSAIGHRRRRELLEIESGQNKIVDRIACRLGIKCDRDGRPFDRLE